MTKPPAPHPKSTTAKRKAKTGRKAHVKLTPEDRLFVDEWFRNGFNATAAARTIFPMTKHPHQAGHARMKKPAVIDEIARRMSEMQDRADLETAEMIRLYENIARADITDVVKWFNAEEIVEEEESGKKVTILKGVVFTKPSDELPRSITCAIAEVWQTRDGIRVKMHDRNEALKRLEAFRELPSSVQRHEHTGPGGGPIPHEVTKVERVVVDPANSNGPGVPAAPRTGAV